MIDDPTDQGIRALFDWRLPAGSATRERAGPAPAEPSNDELALALQLLSCNPRDREQFRGTSLEGQRRPCVIEPATRPR